MPVLTSETQIVDSLKRSKIPDTLHHGITRWILDAIQPGNFLTAIIKNDLKGVVDYGDPDCIKALPEIIRWLVANASTSCWGSQYSIDYWQKLKAAKAR